MKKIKILFFIDSLEHGGIQSMMKNYFEKIDRNLFEIEVLSLEKADTSGYYNWLISEGFKVHLLEGINLNSIIGQLLYMKKLKDFFIYNNDFDILHMNGSSKNFLLLKIAKKNKIPVRIVHSHNTRYQTTNKLQISIGQILTKPLLKYSNAYFAASEIAAKWMFNDTKDVFVLPNAVDVERFKFDGELREKLRKEMNLTNKFVIGNIGRFVHQKNHKKILDVFNRLLQTKKNAYLILAGNGELQDDMKRYVEYLGIKSNVKFLGFRKDINNLLQVMDCYIMPSHYEGLPVVLSEVQATGLSGVVSDVITKEISINANVKFLDLNNSNDIWAQQIKNQQINNIERKAMGEFFEKSYFNIDNSIALLEEQYKSLVNDYK